jgi:hypothetical protein
MRALAGKSSARGHCDKNRTVAQRAHFSFGSHVESSTDSNDVIDPMAPPIGRMMTDAVGSLSSK